MNLRLVTALCFLLALPHAGGFAAENAADATPQAPLFRGDESRPADALVLFDGSDVSAWTTLDGKQPIPWKVENGYMEVRGGSIRTPSWAARSCGPTRTCTGAGALRRAPTATSP